MKGFFDKPSWHEIVRAGFVTCLVINVPLVIYPWYYDTRYGPLPGISIQPFDGACAMAFWSGFPLLLLIGLLDRKEKLLRRLGIVQIVGTLSVSAIPKF